MIAFSKRTFLISGVIAFVVVVVVFLSLPDNERPRAAVQPVSLRIAEASQPVFALLYIAREKGYLADEGLEVSYQSFDSGKRALESVLRGEADIATVFETPIVLKALEGQKVRVISELHNSSRNTGLIARRASGIHEPADLKGKKIAVSRNTHGEFFLYLILTSHGIPLSEVTFVDARPGEMVSLITTGAVDAVATWNPHLSNIIGERVSADEFALFYSEEYTEGSVLAGLETVVTSRPQAMKRLLNALKRAEQDLQNENAAIEITARHLKNQSADDIRKVWDDFSIELRLSTVLFAVLNEEAQWLIDNGQHGETEPDFNKVIYTDYLREVKPESVTVFEIES